MKSQSNTWLLYRLKVARGLRGSHRDLDKLSLLSHRTAKVRAGRKEHDRTKLTCFRISYLNRKERQRMHSMTFLDDDPDG